MHYSRLSRVVFTLSLGMLCLSQAQAIEFENCLSQGPIAFGTYAKQTQQPGADGYHSGLGGLGFLWDIYSLRFAKLGIALSGASSRVKPNDTAASRNEKHRITYITPAFYTRLHYGWLFLTTSAGVGPVRFKTTRTLLNVNGINNNNMDMVASFNGMLSSLRASTGIAVPLENFEITPLAIIDYGRLKKGTRVETGNNGFTVTTAGGLVKAQQQSFGLRFAEISEPNIFYPEFHIFTFHDSNKEKLRVVSRFIPGIPSYVQDGVTPGNSGMNLGASLTSAVLGESVLLTAGFDYERRKNFQGYAAFLKLRIF